MKSIALLSNPFLSFFKNEKIAKEFAFHLADIEPELIETYALLQNIKKTGSVNEKQVEKLLQTICIHWNYHGEEIQKLVELSELRSDLGPDPNAG